MTGFEKLRVGDVVVRMLAGTLPIKLQVSDITEQLIVCSAWQFDKVTGPRSMRSWAGVRHRS